MPGLVRLILYGLCVGVLSGGLFAPRSLAEDQIQRTAQQLVDATVTVRVVGARDMAAVLGGPATAEFAAPDVDESSITVCSGTCLDDNLLVSFGCMPVVDDRQAIKTEYRITLPGGTQAAATPQVVDHHSGLVLLQLKGDAPPEWWALPLADELPETGSVVLTAAASGVEEPLVSRGVVSGVNRTVPGTDLPPLLVCDISTTPASSGAALVDQQANLVGIVAAASLPGEGFGWSYAVPLKHIRRLLDARRAGELTVLPRMRPTLGAVLGPGERQGAIVVQHVVPGGPSDQAGLAAGDRIVAIEGRQVRSVYQAGSLLRKHLPGELITLTCLAPAPRQPERLGQLSAGASAATRRSAVGPLTERVVQVRLGAQSDNSAASVANDVQQQAIKVRFKTPTKLELSNSVRSYDFYLESAPSEAAAEPQRGNARSTPADVSEQLRQYEEMVASLRRESASQRRLLTEREQLIVRLEKELDRLRQEVTPPQNAPAEEP